MSKLPESFLSASEVDAPISVPDENVGHEVGAGRLNRMVRAVVAPVLATTVLLGGVAHEVAQPDTAEAASSHAHRLSHFQKKRLGQACIRVLDVGHRGQIGPNVRKGPDEDTVRALRHGLRLGAGASETDFNLSKDHTWYSIHDKTLNRTVVNGNGLVARKTDAQMAHYRTADGSPIPTEQRWFYAFKHADGGKYFRNGRKLVLELKPQPKEAHLTKDDIRNFDDTIHAAGMQNKVEISSLSAKELKLMNEVDPGLPLQYISPIGVRPKISNVPDYINQINVDYQHAMRPYNGYAHYIGAAHKAGFRVSERLANSTAEYQKFLLAGGDQLMLNNVPQFERFCKQF